MSSFTDVTTTTLWDEKVSLSHRHLLFPRFITCYPRNRIQNYLEPYVSLCRDYTPIKDVLSVPLEVVLLTKQIN